MALYRIYYPTSRRTAVFEGKLDQVKRPRENRRGTMIAIAKGGRDPGYLRPRLTAGRRELQLDGRALIVLERSRQIVYNPRAWISQLDDISRMWLRVHPEWPAELGEDWEEVDDPSKLPLRAVEDHEEVITDGSTP